MTGDGPGATLAESGEFAVIDRLVASRRGCRSDPVTTLQSSPARTDVPW